MISMKKPEMDIEMEESESSGPCIYLSSEQTKALGLDKLPELGKEVMIKAKTVVKSRSEYMHGEGEASKCLELEITEMELGSFSEGSKDAGSILYGSDA